VKYFRFMFVIFPALLASCGGAAPNEAVERARRAERATGDIVIGAAAPWSQQGSMLWQGIELAVKEINDAGGVLGRKIKIIKKDDQGEVEAGKLVAQEFVDNPDVVAVIGHSNSYISIPVSIIYEYHGILMLSPLSTSPSLTQRGFKLVFRNIPTDEAFGKRLSEISENLGYKKVLIYYVRNAYGLQLANSFEEHAPDLGVAIPDRKAYSATTRDMMFQYDLGTWKNYYDFDAIFLAGDIPLAASIMVHARKLNISVPFLGGNAMDSEDLLKIAGSAAEGTIVASPFDPKDPDPLTQEFNAAFLREYGVMPDADAAQGYDAVKVLAHAMEKAQSTVPAQVAKSLRSIKGWPGVTGPHTFDGNGDVVGKPIDIRRVRNGHFEFHGNSDMRLSSPSQ
jgi:branched-chain amino acid transport system substrate-binding protein